MMEPVVYADIKDKVVDPFGRRVVLSLFSEFAGRSKFVPLWSLYDDWKPVYMECFDPTEYEAAMRLMGDWEHYQMVRNHPKIKPIMDKWAVEMEVKLRSFSLRQIIEQAKDPKGHAAAKYLADGGFTGRNKRTKLGREEEAEIQKEMNDRVAADMERMGLSVVRGGR